MKNEDKTRKRSLPPTLTPEQLSCEETLWLMQLDEASNGQLRGKITPEEAKILVKVPFEQWTQELRDKVIPYLDLED